MAAGPPSRGVRQLQVGRYQILDRIATGGMGAVYKALDTKRGREVALKVLPFDLATNKPQLLERFRLEARYGRRLNHDHVVSFYKYGQYKDIYYLAMEYVDGINLHEYVERKGKVSVAESLEIIIQATQAIVHLHQHSITHRDIKPSNFLITQRRGHPWIKLIDLGLARRFSDDVKITHPGSTIGTLDYIAPEQARDSSVADVRSDIYSLGCTWYHLLAGRPPFGEGTLTERIYKHMEVEAPDISQFNAEVPERIKKILQRMMAKDPAQRYQTPKELLEDLEGPAASSKKRSRRVEAQPATIAPLEELVGAAPADEPVAPDMPVRRLRGGGRVFVEDEEGDWSDWRRLRRARKKRRRRPWLLWVGGGIVLAIILGAGLWVWWQGSTPSAAAPAPPPSAPTDSGG